jgi:putative membrane protein
MGFGFVVSRFGLFLRELALAGNAPVLRKPGLSMGIGTTLVLLGVAANLGAAIRYWKTIRRLDRGEPLRFHTISLGSAVAVLLALLGAFVALYLLFEPATRPG